MYSMSIPALLALAVSLSNAQAQAVPNSIPQKLAAFKASKAKLEVELKGFVDAVNVCNPPLVKAQIIDGFAGPANKDNALALLNLREAKVAEHVAEAEAGFSAIGGGNIAGVNACQQGGSAFQSQVMEPAETAAKTAMNKLQAELDLYRAGNAVAAKNEGMVRKVLMARETRIGQLASSAAEIEGCKKAMKFLGDDGKNNGPMKDADKALQAGLSDLHNAYPERLTSIREFGKVLVAGGKCGSAPQRTARFPSMGGGSGDAREGEYQAADLPLESGTSVAR